MKYVSLHNHSNFSLFDGLNYPADFYKYVLESGGDSMAITEHGSMNSLGYAVTAAKALQAKGVKFRPVYGVEAYIHPDLNEWHKAHEERDTENNLVVEDENESKGKWYGTLKRRHHLVITALNNTGLANLFTLVSKSYRRENFYRFPRMDFSLLREHNDGLAISTACLAGLPTYLSLMDDQASDKQVMSLYDRELLPLLEIFGKDRAFLELQFNALAEQTVVNNHLIKYAEHSGYKLIVASDAHYCRPDLWRERELYKALGRQTFSKPGTDLIAEIPKHIEELKCELYPHNAEQIWGAYEKYFQAANAGTDEQVKDAINRTHDIAWQLMSHVEPDSSIKLPKYVPLEKDPPTAFGKLKQLCAQRLKDKGLGDNQEYVQRAVYELKIIRDKNISEYFLTKKAILDALRKKLLLGVGRGSGAGSLVNYLLDITLADPIKGGLLFERFISPSRSELPDIDSDCEDKDQAYEILKTSFGEDNVLAISNYNTLKLKSLVKDVAKLYAVPFEEVNVVTKAMEDEARDAIMDEVGQDQKLYELTFGAAYKHSPVFKEFIDKYPSVGECLATLYKSVKSIGRHAGGVLVVPEAHRHIPIIRVRNVLQCPFTEGITAQHTKLFGLVKFDVLGLTTLKIIRRCIELILKADGNDQPTIDDVWTFYNSQLHPDVIDPADPNVFYNVYQAGKFPSIFQFAEKKVQTFCQRAKPATVKDIAAITALWRPGPLSGEADKRYLEASTGKIHYDHAFLKEVLSESRGILIFQEQFMMLANKLAGFSFDEADKLRKLLVRPSAELGQEMRQQRIKVGERFVAGCMEKGLTFQRAHDLWHKEILGFISYGFNKSHSYAYAYNSYQCAWLYTYFEKEWIKACLEKDPDLEKTIAVVSELGYEVCKPDVNDSLADEWQIIDNKCIPPLVAIKSIGQAAADELIRLRQSGFISIEHFFYDIDEKERFVWRWSKFNKRAIENMIQLGAFESLQCVGEDAMFKNYKHMHSVVMENFDKIKKGIVREGRGKKAIVTNFDLNSITGDPIDDWDNVDKIYIQRELMGTFDKSLLFTQSQLRMIHKYELKPFTDAKDNRVVPVWFFIEEIEDKQTVRGKPYVKLTISDGCGTRKHMNYFEPLHNQLRKRQLHAAKLYMQDWFINADGKIHCIH